MHRPQSREFLIRSRVLPANEIIKSATVDGAELVGLHCCTFAPEKYCRITPALTERLGVATLLRCNSIAAKTDLGYLSLIRAM